MHRMRQLKNKNKSKKVQQCVFLARLYRETCATDQPTRYVQQVQNTARAVSKGGEVRSAEWYAAQEAKKKKEKEEKKQLEKEMMALLGKDYKSEKQKKKEEEEKKRQEEEAKKAEAAAQYEFDFAVPITGLDQVFRIESKSLVTRACGELVWKDNLVGRTKDGSKECVYCKLSDGSTRLPIPLTLIGWTPSTFSVKQGAIVDIRDAVAMIRGSVVDLEVTIGQGTIEEASPNVAEHILQMKEEAEANREKGGVPLEELIEEQRAKLKASELTPITEERFLAWKAKKLKAKQDAEEAKRKELEAKQAKSGANVLSGRALFAYDPTLFKDDEAAEDRYEVPNEMIESDEEAQPQDGISSNVLDDEDDIDMDALNDDDED